MAQSGTRAPRRSSQAVRRGGQDRHDQIVQIAGALFAERGFLATTIRDIADEANILSGSLYHHFESKESIADILLRAYWDELMTEYDAIVAAKLEPAETMRGLLAASIRMLEQHRYAVRMILNDWAYLSGVLPYLDENNARIRKIWTTLLRQGMKRGQFRSDVDPNVTYRTIMSSVTGAGRWFEPGGKLTAEQLANEITDLFLRGLQPGA